MTIMKSNRGSAQRAKFLAIVGLSAFAALAAYKLFWLLQEWESLNGRLFTLIGYDVTPAFLIGVGLFVVFEAIIYLTCSAPRVESFLAATEVEVTKVVWPKRAQVVKAAVAVIVTVVILAVYMFCWDSLFAMFFREIGYMPGGSSA